MTFAVLFSDKIFKFCHPFQVCRRGIRLYGVGFVVARTVMSALCCLASFAPLYAAATPDSVVIHMSDDSTVTVRTFAESRVDLGRGKSGLVVWAAGNRDCWDFFNVSWERPKATANAEQAFELVADSRGFAWLPSEVSHHLQLTTQLPQLRTPLLTRGVGTILTPYERAILLDGRVTFRRSNLRKEKLPAAVAVVRKGKEELLKVRFGEGVNTIKWSEIEGLPNELKAGIAPGTYELEVASIIGPERVTFSVAEPSLSEQLLSQQKKFSTFLSPSDPLAIQVAVEALLDHRPSLLSDAANLLDDLEQSNRTARLDSLRDHVMQRLHDPSQRPGPPVIQDSTGDEEIDSIRSLIAVSRWRDALDNLNSLALTDSLDKLDGKRRAALIHLYRGVVLSEAGLARETETKMAYERALAVLTTIPNSETDLFRAHNNFAGFLFGRCQDRLHNHAAQIATGKHLPLLTALHEWIGARQQYEFAYAAAKAHEQKATIELNMAHQWVVLGNFIRTLGNAQSAEGKEPRIENAAYLTASNLLKGIVSVGPTKPDLQIKGIAEELLAQVCFWRGDKRSAEQQAKDAMSTYVQIGLLPGVESVSRLLGVIARENGNVANAITHFETSEALAGLLRARYVSDESGFTVTGFMARRSFVSEQLVDLFAERGEPLAALQHAETAKARAFLDILEAAGKLNRGNATEYLSEILSKWPKRTVAVEYFFTSDKCWAFIVAGSEDVSVIDLKSEDGKPIGPRSLITAVREAREMLNEYKSRWQDEAFTRRFEHSWQAQQHSLYHVLIPIQLRDKLQQADRFVVVPHHILHYLPFSALVTQTDPQEMEDQMAMPRYLLDEPYAISYAPSLSSFYQFMQAPQVALEKVGVVADTRPESRLKEVASEVQSIRTSFQGHTIVAHEGSDATICHAIDVLRQSNLAFFGCHGQNVWDSPLEGHLLLSDGNLTARALLDQEVNASVVILSACHSGLADRSPQPGDDLFGLERVLLSRGAGCVVSGCWLVDDLRGARITGAFIDGLSMGKPADEALAHAQRLILKRYRTSSDQRLRFFSHPHFWAVFRLSGVYNPINHIVR
jgi:CHAT domain-containing protein